MRRVFELDVVCVVEWIEGGGGGFEKCGGMDRGRRRWI